MTAEDCLKAIGLEEYCRQEVAIFPGMSAWARHTATAAVRQKEVVRQMVEVWTALSAILQEDAKAPALRVAPPSEKSGLHHVILHNHRNLVPQLAGVPILHLDATLRPELAGRILPGLDLVRIEAAQPHQHVTLVTGKFGKTTLCPEARLSREERLRRKNRLREVVDHVRWRARRVAPGGVLVVTYMAIEAEFAGIPGVKTAHFNATAGLDQFRDVALLIVIGRPLPSSDDLAPLCASLFGHLPEGHYLPELRAVRLHDRVQAVVRTPAHPDPQAELLRAAVCDDELIQAIGRGRGVNRTGTNPLEVQILADVALPLIHDRVLAWDSGVPDIVQRMLLAGVAVDSPADAAALHPGVFCTANQAKMAFRAGPFECQNPICNPYREMTLKSAAYRRNGRGRSWQQVWWIDGDADSVRARLEAALGPLAEWRPE